MTQFTQKQITQVFVLIAILLSATSALPIQGNSATRVRFPRGRTSVVLKGSVKDGRTNQYILQAREGQTITIHMATSPKNFGTFTLYLPVQPDSADRGAEEVALFAAQDVTDWKGALPKSGEWVIRVETGGRKIPYTLKITIR